MAHPTKTKTIRGVIWHLEDENLSAVSAVALRKHLTYTEEKMAKVERTHNGKYEVWWAKKK